MSAIAKSDLPGVLAEVAEVAGHDAAIQLALEFGGESIHVPRKGHLNSGHRLTEALGSDAVLAICRHFSGESLYIPMARRLMVRHLAGQGMTNRHIARRLGLSIRTTRHYRSVLRG